MLPAGRLLAVALVGVVVCALPGRRREVSFAGLTGLLLLSQGLVHAVLCLCHCTTGSLVGSVVHRLLCPGLATAEQASWSADPLLLVPASGAGSAGSVGYGAHLFPGAMMLVAHVAAAVVTAWWLRRGEAAVWQAIRSVWPRLVAVVRTALVVPPSVRSPAYTVPERLRTLVESFALHPHRGPPLRA